jgi:hypothetical protein
LIRRTEKEMRLNHRRASIALTALLIGILACSLPGGAATETPTPEEDLAGTITAQAETLQAPSAAPSPPTETPTIAETTTPSVPMVSVSSATNCRSGNGAMFDWLFAMDPGDEAEVVGKNTASGYWIIKYPGGQCWLWGQYASVAGDTSGLPEFPAPPTPTPSTPAAPSNFKATVSCSPNPATLTLWVHVTLTWTDVAISDDGYRIFRDGELLVTLEPDGTSYQDDTTLPLPPATLTPIPPPSVKYGIEAFNSAGKSDRKNVTVDCG